MFDNRQLIILIGVFSKNNICRRYCDSLHLQLNLFTMKKLFTLFVSAFLFSAGAFSQANCAAPSSGFTPINDLGAGTFTNAWSTVWTGGLYPNGSNFIPSVHKTAGLQMASQIQCLDTAGNPDAVNGKIVWLSIGMSNCTMETQQFMPQANAFAGKNPKLTLVDGAQGGQTAQIVSSPWNASYANFWNTVSTRLATANVSAKQVQVIWFKEANQAGATLIQTYYDSLIVQIKRCMNELKTRFPNVKMCYLASRISGRYASSTLNPEPYSYYTGWAVKKVIEDQINGDAQLTYSGSGAKSPWLAWGIYMWSDGSTPQITNPNVFFTCPTDFQNDGTHPSIPTGAAKVGTLLLNFFSTDSTSAPWFLGTGCPMGTEVSENENENLISIFPNPFNASAVLRITNHGELRIEDIKMLNVVGKEVHPIIIRNSDSFVISRENLSSGIYFLKIKNEKGNYFKKLVVTN